MPRLDLPGAPVNTDTLCMAELGRKAHVYRSVPINTATTSRLDNGLKG